MINFQKSFTGRHSVTTESHNTLHYLVK